MNNEIKKAISKAMAKLVGFSFNEKKMNGKTIEVALMGRFRNDVWVTDNSNNAVIIIGAPLFIDAIPSYERQIEKAIAELTVKFYTSDKIMATLNTEVNE